MQERRLPYPTFDADNHMYETEDALTKFIPKEFEGVIKYVEINGRTKVAMSDHLSDYIPNPTFNVVAVPGGYGRDRTPRRARGSTSPRREAEDHAERRGVLRSRTSARVDEGHGHRPRLMWPTLAERGGGAPRRRSRRRVCGRARAERVDARALDVQLLPTRSSPRRSSVSRRSTPRSTSCSASPSAVRVRSSSAWRRCRRTVAGGRSRCPSSTRSGSS